MIGRKVIYSEPQSVFFEDILLNRVAEKMMIGQSSNLGKSPQGPEYRSWQNSPVAIKNLIELSGVKDIYVTFEYLLPYTEMRIDCMLYGMDEKNRGKVIHIELKQWNKVVETDIEGNFVETYTGRPNNRVPHPSQQVKGYHDFLTGFIQVFEQGTLDLFGCAYCHNYKTENGTGLHAPIYKDIMDEYPLYAGNEVQSLAERLRSLLNGGRGYEIFNKFMQSPVNPSKKLLESASKIISNSSDFVLLNDQIVARNTILAKVSAAKKNKEKSVVIIKGGPGTGKTVIALHILAEIAGRKDTKNVFFATRSKPLLEGIKSMLDRGSEAKPLFTNLSQYIPSKMDENQVDLLIIDEAHRVEERSNNRFTRPQDLTSLSRMETLIRAAKTSVFFIDDKQNIRSDEIGSSQLIEKVAREYGAAVEEVTLVSEFRCNGSDNYLDWLEAALGHTTETRILTEKDNYDFKIFNTLTSLYQELVERNTGNTTSRLVAGYCWHWSKTLDEKGELIKDVCIGDFAMPWETHGEISKPPKGYVKWYEWAYKPEGIKQVGCIYTTQGFEFDYIGVIIGPDLRYDAQTDSLYTDITATKDTTLKRGKKNFDDYVRNIYRVLMTRGTKGCYVYFVDDQVRQYFERRLAGKLSKV
ncbi:DUF2075 domain-containing protein [Pedobacter sp. 22226]|uniref:DUF2075 domain-containing protein n=1 Tax=Pedobacter sp. 22226 TaxID=3453894 RepID=UPI003F837F10